MQVLDEKKRKKILSAAADLFSTNAFHKVLLSDVAEAAGVGKGTLYIYFKNKEDLYSAVLFDVFARLVDGLRERMEETERGSRESLKCTITRMIDYAYENPKYLELMRSFPGSEILHQEKWTQKRAELARLIESIIRRGVAAGELVDPHPELTARFIPGMVRYVLLDGGLIVEREVSREVLVEHVLRFVCSALVPQEARS